MSMVNFNGSDDFFDVVYDYLSRINAVGIRANLARGEAFQISNKPAVSGRRIFGAIESGEYGDESPVVDVNSGSTKYTKTVDDALLRPYYFSFYVSKNRNVAVVLLQRYKQFGIQSMFIGGLQNWFKSNHPDYEIDFDYVVASNFVEQVISRGSIRSLHFYQYRAPSDIVDEYDQGYQQVEGYMEVAFRARKEGFPLKQKLINLIQGSNPNSLRGAFIFKDALKNFDYSGFKVVIRDGNKQRTIDFSEIGSIRADYSLDEEVAVVKTVPIFEQVDQYAATLTRDLLINLGFIDGDSNEQN